MFIVQYEVKDFIPFTNDNKKTEITWSAICHSHVNCNVK
jgi:hypothetical protein